MTFKELTHVYLERVVRLDYWDDTEWDSYLKAWYVEIGNPETIFAAYLEQELVKGIDFEDLCQRDRAAHLAKLPSSVLKPPTIFL